MKKVFKNIFASALPQIMNIVTNLLLPTLIIGKFGSDVNGLLSSTKALVSYISIIGAGIATAATQALYVPVANKNTSEIKGMLHAASNMFNKFGLIYCVVAMLIAVVYPFSINTDIGYFTAVSLMIVMSISGASEFFVIGRCRALLYANQKTYICTTVQAASLLGSLLLALVMLKLNASIVIVQFSISFVYVLRAFFLSSYVKRTYPELIDYKDEEPINSAIEKRNDAMIHQISGLAVTSSQTTILTMVVGLGAASIYSVYNIVFSGLQSICANLSMAVTPFIGREYALENRTRLKKIYDVIELLFFSLVVFVYSVAMIMVIPFVELYTKGADINYIYPTFASVFVLSSAFYILKMPSNSLINISGRFKETRWRAIIEAILTVVLSFVLTWLMGISGVVVGTGVALCWRCIDTIVYTNKYVIGCSNFKSIFRLFRVIVCIILCSVIRREIHLEINNYTDWVIWSALISLIVLMIVIINIFIFDFSTIKDVLKVFRKRSA